MSSPVKICEPLTLPSGLVVPNRIVKAAMSENLATPGGEPSDGLIELYRRLGRGGAGLLITGNVIVDPGGRTEPHNVLLIDKRQARRLKPWAQAAKAHGSAVLMQLNHAGRQTDRSVTWTPVAPSAIRVDREGGLFSTPVALTIAQIERLVERFGRAAAMAKEAGFDGVQIHAAHGYLLSQFLSPLCNHRSDRYGGELQGRMRIVLEIVREVRHRCGGQFTLSVKLNSADFQRGGFSMEESMLVAQALQREGIDLLEISGGSYERPVMMESESELRASTRDREAFFLEYAQKIREVVTLPLMVTGGFRSRAAMNAALGSDAVDLIGMARPLALEPDLPGQLIRAERDTASSVALGVGVRLLDNLLQIHWYQQQLVRMSEGHEPSVELGRWSTVLGAVGHRYMRMVTHGWRRREGHTLDAATT